MNTDQQAKVQLPETIYPDTATVIANSKNSGGHHYVRADISRPTPGDDQPLIAEIREGRLVISIGVRMLSFAAVNLDDWPPDVIITDAPGFAADVLTALLNESETGNSIVTRSLDAAFKEIVENGSEHIDVGNPNIVPPAADDHFADAGKVIDEEDCPHCGGGGYIEGNCTCGDDTCCCADPEPPPCSICKGS